MKLGSVVLVTLAATAAVACKSAPVTPPTPAIAKPAEVVAVVTMPSFEANLPRLTGFLEKVSPGTGVALRAEIEGEFIPDAIDWKKPMYLVVLAPTAGSHEPELVAVVGPRDQTGLEKTLEDDDVMRIANGWAVLGKAGPVDRVLAWATTSMVATPAPTRLSAVAYPAAIDAALADDIAHELAGGPPSPATTALRDTVLGLLQQTERIDAYADVVAEDWITEITVTPRAGSTLANVFAAQKPSTFDLFAQIPIPPVSGTMAGHIELGPLSKPTHDLVTSLVETELADAPPGVTSALGALVDTVFKVSTGEYAGVATIPGNVVVNMFGVTDTARAKTALDDIARAAAIGMPPGTKLVVESAEPAGDVAITTARLMAGEFSALGGSWAAWDGRLAIVLPDPDGRVMRFAIDASRRKAPLPRAMARVIADARQRGDSLIDTIDVMEGDQAPLVMAFGVRSGAAYLWARFPVEQIKVIAAQFGGG